MSPLLTFLFGAALLLLLLVYVGTTELKRKRLLGTILSVAAALLAVYTVKQIGIKKGIDLQGGSEFVVALPASNGHAAPAVASAKLPTASASANVLVVEDDPAVRDVVVSWLTEIGYRTNAASSAEHALAERDARAGVNRRAEAADANGFPA